MKSLETTAAEIFALCQGDHDTDQIAALIKAHIEANPPPYPIPGPYEIALAMGTSLAATGRFDTPGAAWAAAWASVPEFFAGRDYYLQELVPAIYGRQAGEAGDGESFHS